MFGWPFRSWTSYELDRPEVDPYAHLQWSDNSRWRDRDRIAQSNTDEERVLGVTDEADRGPISGIQNDPVIGRNVPEGFREQRIQLLLEPDLFRDRLPGIFDDVDEDDATNECPVPPRQHAFIRNS